MSTLDTVTLRFVGYPVTDVTSDLVKVGQGGGWAGHVETLMPDGTLLGAMTAGGVQARPRDYDAGQFSRELFVPITMPGEAFGGHGTPADQVEAYYAFLRAQIGKPYSMTTDLGVFLEQDWHTAGSWMCSMLEAAGLGVYVAGYFPELYIPPWHITPRDLLLLITARQAVQNGAR